MKKRFFSVLLTICMLMCLVPAVHVSAAFCVLNGNTLREVLEKHPEVTKLKVLTGLSDDIPVTKRFYLSTLHTVVGFIDTETKKLFIAPHNKGRKVSLPENCREFFMGLNLEEIDLGEINTEDVTDMSCMFKSCEKLKKLNLNGFKTGNVKLMNSMFCRCRSLESLDLSSFDTSKVTNMNNMFHECESIKNLDLSSFDTKALTSVCSMFGWCTNLEKLDIRGLDFSKVSPCLAFDILSGSKATVYCSDETWKLITLAYSSFEFCGKRGIVC